MAVVRLEVSSKRAHVDEFHLACRTIIVTRLVVSCGCVVTNPMGDDCAGLLERFPCFVLASFDILASIDWPRTYVEEQDFVLLCC